jgi:hypothetical protein
MEVHTYQCIQKMTQLSPTDLDFVTCSGVQGCDLGQREGHISTTTQADFMMPLDRYETFVGRRDIPDRIYVRLSFL